MSFDVASISLTATLKIDPSSQNTQAGSIKAFLAWLAADETFSDPDSIIPGLENILVRLTEVKIVQASGKIEISQFTIKAKYSNPSWTVPNPNPGGSPLVVPLLVRFFRQMLCEGDAVTDAE